MGFKAGKGSKVSITLDGQEDTVDLCNFRHNHSENDEGLDITSVCHNGTQAFISTILRGQASASFHVKSDQLPWTVGITAQATGDLLIEYGQGAYVFTFPFLITSVDYQNETAGGCDFSVNFKLNAEGGGGVYTRPS